MAIPLLQGGHGRPRTAPVSCRWSTARANFVSGLTVLPGPAADRAEIDVGLADSANGAPVILLGAQPVVLSRVIRYLAHRFAVRTSTGPCSARRRRWLQVWQSGSLRFPLRAIWATGFHSPQPSAVEHCTAGLSSDTTLTLVAVRDDCRNRRALCRIGPESAQHV